MKLKIIVDFCYSGNDRELRLPDASLRKISSLMEGNYEFTISCWIRQEKQNVGTIVSFTHGENRYLELQSSGRKNEIRFHYTSVLDAKVYVETFHYKLADNSWHHVAVSVSGWETELFVDCKSLNRRILKPGAPATNFTDTQLWLGQRYKQFPFKVCSRRKYQLKFSLQVRRNVEINVTFFSV